MPSAGAYHMHIAAQSGNKGLVVALAGLCEILHKLLHNGIISFHLIAASARPPGKY